MSTTETSWRARAADPGAEENQEWRGRWRPYFNARAQAARWAAEREMVWLECSDGQRVEVVQGFDDHGLPEPYTPPETGL